MFVEVEGEAGDDLVGQGVGDAVLGGFLGEVHVEELFVDDVVAIDAADGAAGECIAGVAGGVEAPDGGADIAGASGGIVCLDIEVCGGFGVGDGEFVAFGHRAIVTLQALLQGLAEKLAGAVGDDGNVDRLQCGFLRAARCI